MYWSDIFYGGLMNHNRPLLEIRPVSCTLHYMAWTYAECNKTMLFINVIKVTNDNSAPFQFDFKLLQIFSMVFDSYTHWDAYTRTSVGVLGIGYKWSLMQSQKKNHIKMVMGWEGIYLYFRFLPPILNEYECMHCFWLRSIVSTEIYTNPFHSCNFHILYPWSGKLLSWFFPMSSTI